MEADRVSRSAARNRTAGRPVSRRGPNPHRRARMPRQKRDPAARQPSPYERAGSEAVNATVARVAPAVLGLLGGWPAPSRPAIVEALAGRHPKDDVVHTLIRLAVTGQVVETAAGTSLAASSRDHALPWRSWPVHHRLTGPVRRPAAPASAAAARPRSSPAPRPRPGGRAPAAAPRRSPRARRRGSSGSSPGSGTAGQRPASVPIRDRHRSTSPSSGATRSAKTSLCRPWAPPHLSRLRTVPRSSQASTRLTTATGLSSTPRSVSSRSR